LQKTPCVFSTTNSLGLQEFGVTVTTNLGFRLRQELCSNTILRPKQLWANLGTGWRTVNLFSENIGLLVSSRDIIFSEQLQPEKAVNFGFNLTQKFETKNNNLSGYFSADYYRTEFQNQIFPDYDSDPTKQ
jgi:outer membrane receptor for ferrienterochelin and colicins